MSKTDSLREERLDGDEVEVDGGQLDVEGDEEVVCTHCSCPCWLSEDPCAEAEMRRRCEQEATTARQRDGLEAFFLRLLLLDNINQGAKVQHGPYITVFSRSGRSQGLLYKHCCVSIIE